MFENKYIERTNGGKLFTNCYYQKENEVGNIMFCCTPTISVSEPEIEACYLYFADYGYNVFAFDFYGTCQSDGFSSDIEPTTIIEDFETIVSHIKMISDSPIFLFGDTGTGGIMGQFYAAHSQQIAAFAQYGQVIYRDASCIFNGPKPIITIVYLIVKALSSFFPKMQVKLSIPKYSGYNAKKEDEFYAMLEEKRPDFRKFSLCLFYTIFWFLYNKKSPVAAPLKTPTLVFNARHDRYFTNEYVQRYFKGLLGKKKIVHIDDCHNSYFFQSKYIANEVDKWFREILNQEQVD